MVEQLSDKELVQVRVLTSQYDPRWCTSWVRNLPKGFTEGCCWDESPRIVKVYLRLLSSLGSSCEEGWVRSS